MARKDVFRYGNRKAINEDMFVSNDERSVSRGRRVAPRTEVCRPCLAWLDDAGDQKYQGVVLDLNPYGMLVRMLDAFPADTVLTLQLMRDDAFRVPLGPPMRVVVRRSTTTPEGFTDHGVQRQLPKIRKAAEFVPVRSDHTRPFRRPATRMYTVDHTLGDSARRTRRSRG